MFDGANWGFQVNKHATIDNVSKLPNLVSKLRRVVLFGFDTHPFNWLCNYLRAFMWTNLKLSIPCPSSTTCIARRSSGSALGIYLSAWIVRLHSARSCFDVSPWFLEKCLLYGVRSQTVLYTVSDNQIHTRAKHRQHDSTVHSSWQDSNSQ